MNPRLTGVTPLTNQVTRERRQPPLVLFHLLEWMGIDFSLDVEQFNQQWVESSSAPSWSQLIIEHIRDEAETLTAETLTHAVPSGVWRMQSDGELRFSRQAFQTQAASGESEAFFMRTIDAGHMAFKGSSLGRLTLRHRLMDDRYRLTARAAAWIRGFRQLLDSSSRPRLLSPDRPATE